MSPLSARSSPIQLIGRAAFYISFPVGFLGLLLPVYGRLVGASPLKIGMLFSVFSLTTVALRPIIGRLVDRWGRRPFVLAGLGFWTVTQLLFALIQSYTGLLVARILQGLGSSTFWLAAYATVADVAGPEARGASYGRVLASSARGALLGAVLGFALFSGALAVRGHGSELLAILAGFVVYSALAAYALWRTWRLKETRPPRTGPQDAAPYRPGYPVLLGIVFLTASVQAMLPPVLIIYLQDHVTRELPLLAMGYIPAAVVWGLVPGRAGRLADRWGKRLVMAAGLTVGAVVSAALPLARNLGVLSVLWALEAAALSLAIPAEQALVSDLSGQVTRGRAFGLYDFSSGMGFVLGPLAGTALYQAVDPSAPFFANAAGLIVAALLLLAAGRRLRAD